LTDFQNTGTFWPIPTGT